MQSTRCPPVDHAGYVPLPHQQRIIDQFVNTSHKGMIVYGGLGSGKCVMGDSIITVNDKKVTIKDAFDATLVQSGPDKTETWAMVCRDHRVLIDSGNGSKTNVAAWFRQLIDEMVYEITLKSGVKVTATAVHRFLTQNSSDQKPKLSKDLRSSDYLVHSNGKTDPISKIRVYHYNGYVYDVNVGDKNHQYVVNGLMSFNTCSSIFICDELLYRGKASKAYILTPGSLRSNFIDSYCEQCGSSPNRFHRDYMFASYNYSRVMEKLPPSFNDGIVVIDEAHMLINGKRNEGKQKAKVYDMIDRSNCRVILLTGTPMYGGRMDAAFLIQLCKPGRVGSIDDASFEAFVSNEVALAHAFEGIVSYVPGFDMSYYPDAKEDEFVRVPMSSYQWEYYKKAVSKENKAISQAARTEHRIRGRAVQRLPYYLQQRIKSRQFSNIAYPIEISMALLSDTSRNALNASNSKTLDRELVKDDNFLANLKVYSAKMHTLIMNMVENPGKHMVYTKFKTTHGAVLLMEILKHCGFDPVMYSGDLSTDEKRRKVLGSFNAPDNDDGYKHIAIISTEAGFQGLDLKTTMYQHILEPSGNEMIEKQVKGRINRYRSHERLPSNRRWTRTFRYISVPPEEEKNEYEEADKTGSVDELMLRRGLEKLDEIQPILDIMKRSAFDCEFADDMDHCYDFIGQDDNDEGGFY